MIGVLDRTMGKAVAVRAVLALLIGTGLLLVADILGRIGTVPDIIARSGWGTLGLAYLLRIPEMAAMWLPAVPALAATALAGVPLSVPPSLTTLSMAPTGRW